MPTLSEVIYYCSGKINPPDEIWLKESIWTCTPFLLSPSTPFGGRASNWYVFNESNGSYEIYSNNAKNNCRCVR